MSAHNRVPLLADLAGLSEFAGSAEFAGLIGAINPGTLLAEQGLTLPIAVENWASYGENRVRASVSLGYARTTLWLYFQVREPEIRSTITLDQGPVYTDSCVEFFVTPPGFSPDYLNFEFNSAGALLHFRGQDRHKRIPAKPEILSQVIRVPRISGPNHWSLLAGLPGGVFGSDHIPQGHWKANFYKCGDSLKKPHYFSWAPIQTDSPDFHRPEFFKILEF